MKGIKMKVLKYITEIMMMMIVPWFLLNKTAVFLISYSLRNNTDMRQLIDFIIFIIGLFVVISTNIGFPTLIIYLNMQKINIIMQKIKSKGIHALKTITLLYNWTQDR